MIELAAGSRLAPSVTMQGFGGASVLVCAQQVLKLLNPQVLETSHYIVHAESSICPCLQTSSQISSRSSSKSSSTTPKSPTVTLSGLTNKPLFFAHSK